MILLLIFLILSADIISGTAFIYGHVGCFAEFYFEVSWNNAGVHYSSVHHLHLCNAIFWHYKLSSFNSPINSYVNYWNRYLSYTSITASVYFSTIVSVFAILFYLNMSVWFLFIWVLVIVIFLYRPTVLFYIRETSIPSDVIWEMKVKIQWTWKILSRCTGEPGTRRWGTSLKMKNTQKNFKN